MTPDRFRADLADLADEVTSVDLRDRAVRTSHRLRIRRVVAISAAALVLLGAATGTAIVLRSGGTAAPQLPAGTPSVTAPVQPAPVPSTADPSVPAGGGPSNLPGAPFGQLFYGQGPEMTDAERGRVYSLRPGSTPARLLELPRMAALLNAAVSPDGRRIVWVDEQAALWLADVDGTDRRKLRDGVDGQCWGPTWAPDSDRLAVALVTPTSPGDYRTGVLDVGSGTFTEVGKLKGCHPLWSADGRVLAFPDGDTGRVVVADPDGTGQRFIPDLGGDARYDSFDVAGLSPDGTRIALLRRGPDVPSGDVARELAVNAVLDTRTGAEIGLPLGGHRLLQAYFQSDGNLLARVRAGTGNRLMLISPDGRKLAETAEPAALKDMQIIQVTG
ncbi:PD40 domain-containing protein [Micromonospora echinofusca]|uniref:PD40 domain-containing protein n=1 Tax=Micromonospora echinofusca TaxID=47858 RepID=UPI001AD7DA35|nr:PD40 domain-containing protein [Micromonospora echinofusca]